MSESVENFIAAAREGLAMQTSAHTSSWNLANAGSWAADLDEGTVTFQFEDGITAKAPMQIIGTYNLADGTFLWGWDHPSVDEPLRSHAKLAFEWGQANGAEAFTHRKVTCTEDDAWSFTAVANRLANANGAYRGSSGSTLVFMTFGKVTLHKN